MNVSDIMLLNTNLRGQKNSVLWESGIQRLMLTSQKKSVQFETNVVVLSRRPPLEFYMETKPDRLFTGKMDPILVPSTRRNIVYLDKNSATRSSSQLGIARKAYKGSAGAVPL